MKFRFEPEDFVNLYTDYASVDPGIAKVISDRANTLLKIHEKSLPRVYYCPQEERWNRGTNAEEEDTHTALLWGIEEIG